MNATELFHADGRTADIFYCGKCRIVHRTQSFAEKCCAPIMCECGAKAEQYRTECAACWRAKEVQREAEKFAKAEKLSAWDGWVFWDGTGHNDGFFPSLEELEEHLECNDDLPLPAYVWTCNRIPFVTSILDRTLNCISENSSDDWDTSSLSGLPEFELAVKAFEEANKDQVSWDPNYKQALILAQ